MYAIFHQTFSTNSCSVTKFPHQISTKHLPPKPIFHSLNIWVLHSLLGLVSQNVNIINFFICNPFNRNVVHTIIWFNNITFQRHCNWMLPSNSDMYLSHFVAADQRRGISYNSKGNPFLPLWTKAWREGISNLFFSLIGPVGHNILWENIWNRSFGKFLTWIQH